LPEIALFSFLKDSDQQTYKKPLIGAAGGGAAGETKRR